MVKQLVLSNWYRSAIKSPLAQRDYRYGLPSRVRCRDRQTWQPAQKLSRVVRVCPVLIETPL